MKGFYIFCLSTGLIDMIFIDEFLRPTKEKVPFICFVQTTLFDVRGGDFDWNSGVDNDNNRRGHVRFQGSEKVLGN